MTATSARPPSPVRPAAAAPPDFDALFAGSTDPWGFRTRWYEIRKRALTLACLPQPRYGHAFEPGCANGELTAALATRCDHVLACDGASRAVEIARQRLQGLANVDVRQALLPDDWPPGGPGADIARFDLIVVSEVAYYLDPAALTRLVERATAALLPGGTLLACHWRRPIAGCELHGDAVHALLHDQLQLPHLTTVLDADLRLDVWQDHALSVAQREGLA